MRPWSTRRNAKPSARQSEPSSTTSSTRIDVTQSYVDACVEAHAEGELSAVDAAKAKYWTAEIQNDALDACVQLHGGYGFMREYRVAQAWMDARVTKIWGGTNEIMKEIIGRDLGL
jgi:long-chain-acyl-CoA dehydrogenase